MPLEIGQVAPDFTLRNQDRKKVILSELKGQPIVLVFYPLDFSGLCTDELCSVRDDYGSWEEKGAIIFGISRDSIFCHAAFKEAQNIGHDLLSDMKGEVATLYDTWNEEGAIANRLTVVVSSDGTIAYTTQSETNAEARNHSEVAEHIS